MSSSMNADPSVPQGDLPIQIDSAMEKFYVGLLAEMLGRATTRNSLCVFSFDLPPAEQQRLLGIARAALRQAQGVQS